MTSTVYLLFEGSKNVLDLEQISLRVIILKDDADLPFRIPLEIIVSTDLVLFCVAELFAHGLASFDELVEGTRCVNIQFYYRIVFELFSCKLERAGLVATEDPIDCIVCLEELALFGINEILE